MGKESGIFFKKTIYVQASLNKNMFFCSMLKKKAWKHHQQKLCFKYTFNQKRSEESSRNVCSVDLIDCIGKEELYLRKITIFDVWD